MLQVLGEERGERVEVLAVVLAGLVGIVLKAKPTVMSRVFDGGEGVISGGRAERSRESGGWVGLDMDVDAGLPEEEAGGDVS